MIVVWFLILIGPLIFIHELGHFLFAKLFKVKVLRFSLGFGPAIKGCSWKWGDTEYRIAYFPLGGYVKMAGDDPTVEVAPEDRAKAFNYKPLWQRYLVIVAGPLFNVLFPLLLYFFYQLGQTTSPPAVIGTVLPNEPAAKAGLVAGDRILSINGKKVLYWSDMTRIIRANPNRKVVISFEREGRKRKVEVRPRLFLEETRLGVVEKIGLLGVIPAFTLAQIGVSDPESPAARAGLRTGDWITSVNGKPTRYWHQLSSRLAEIRNVSRPIDLTVLRPSAVKEGAFLDLKILRPLVVRVLAIIDGEGKIQTGILPYEMFLEKVDPESPAYFLGLRPNDRVLTLGGKPVKSWVDLSNILLRKKSRPIEVTWKPFHGKVRRGILQQRRQESVDEFKQKQVTYLFGATNRVTYIPLEEIPIHNRLMFAARNSFLMIGEVFSDMVTAIIQIFRGRVPSDSVGGPIMLANIAKTAASKGLEFFLWIMALISINLALLNILPIPILDGGHLLIFTIEAVRRKPLSLEARAIMTYAGLLVIIGLMILAFRNDIIRYVLNN